ncbi:MAG: SurA N-terminal domain-containing protein [Trueperaceae bacterium]
MRHLRTLIRPLSLLALTIATIVGSAALAQDDDPVVLSVDGEERTLSQFEQRFEIALRSAASQQGVPMNDEIRAQLEAYAGPFLDQLAQEIAWLHEADARDIEISEAEVDQVVADLRGDGDDQAFAELLDQSGIGDVETLRRLVEEGERITRLQQQLGADVEVSDEEVRETYEATPEASDREFDEVRDQIEAQLVNQVVQQELSAIVAEADVATYPDRLPYEVESTDDF